MKRLFLFLTILLAISGVCYAQQWDVDSPAGTNSVSDIDTYVGYNNTAVDRLVAGYNTIALVYNSASQITASAGEVTVSNSDGSVRLFLRNTSTTTITWADIDAGAEAGSTTYYVYAIAALVTSETATFKVSTSSTAPAGATYYKKIGSFYNNSSSNIDREKIYTIAYGNTVNDSDGAPLFAGIYDYSSSLSSYSYKTSGIKIAFGTGTQSSGSMTVSNLPFTNTNSYSVSCQRIHNYASQYLSISAKSASSFTCYDNLGASLTVNWVALGY
jgi:hypothetical protein